MKFLTYLHRGMLVVLISMLCCGPPPLQALQENHALAPRAISLPTIEVELALRLTSVLKVWRSNGSLKDLREADTQAQLALHEQGDLTGDMLLDFSTVRIFDPEGSTGSLRAWLRTPNGQSQEIVVFLFGDAPEPQQARAFQEFFQDSYDEIVSRGYAPIWATSWQEFAGRRPDLDVGEGSIGQFGGEGEIPEDFDDAIKARWRHVLDDALENEPDPQKRAIAYPATSQEHRVQVGPNVLLYQEQSKDKRITSAPKEIIAYDHRRPEKFEFTKIKNPKEELGRVGLHGSRWRALTNKFPWVRFHTLLTSETWRPQLLLPDDVLNFLRMQEQAPELIGFFNGWGAGASVNHLHVQTFYDEDDLAIDRMWPMPLGEVGSVKVGMLDHPMGNLTFEGNDTMLVAQTVGKYLQGLRDQHIPHDVIFLRGRVAVFPFHNEPEKDMSTFYQKTARNLPIAGIEIMGVFTTAAADSLEELSDVKSEDIARLLRETGLATPALLKITHKILGAKVAGRLQRNLAGSRPLEPILKPNPHHHLDVLRDLGYDFPKELIKDVRFDALGRLTFQKRLKRGTGTVTFKYANDEPVQLDGPLEDVFALLAEKPPEQIRYLVFKSLVKHRSRALALMPQIVEYAKVEESRMVLHEMLVATNMILGTTVEGKKRMSIVYPTYEAEPLVKKGGVADVNGTLPRVLRNKLGHNASVVMPYWKFIDENIKDRPDLEIESENLRFFIDGERVDIYSVVVDGTPMYLLKNDKYFDVEGTVDVPHPDGTIEKVTIEAHDIYRSAADRAYQKAHEGTSKKHNMHRLNAETAIFFSKATLAALETLGARDKWSPDIINTSDWQSGLIPSLLKRTERFNNAFFAGTKTVHTIHNLPYKGLWSRDEPGLWEMTGLPEDAYKQADHMGVEFHDNVSLMKAGVVDSDKPSTVSPQYAKEIQTAEFGGGFEEIFQVRKPVGIINGLSRRELNFAHSPGVQVRANHTVSEEAVLFGVVEVNEGKRLNRRFAERYFGLNDRSNERIPLFGYVGRLEDDKGNHVLLPAVERMLQEGTAQFIFTGRGNPEHVDTLARLAEQYPGNIVHTGFVSNDELQLIYAATDTPPLLSLYEPCGLVHLQSMRFGDIPLVNDVGGLHDTMSDFATAGELGNGFVVDLASVFGEEATREDKIRLGAQVAYDAMGRVREAYRNKESWEEMVRRELVQSEDFGWEVSARDYDQLYRLVLGEPVGALPTGPMGRTMDEVVVANEELAFAM